MARPLELEEVRAPCSGVVVAVDKGNPRTASSPDEIAVYFTANDDGIAMLFAHLTAIAVKPGDDLSRGALIGYLDVAR